MSDHVLDPLWYSHIEGNVNADKESFYGKPGVQMANMTPGSPQGMCFPSFSLLRAKQKMHRREEYSFARRDAKALSALRAPYSVH